MSSVPTKLRVCCFAAETQGDAVSSGTTSPPASYFVPTAGIATGKAEMVVSMAIRDHGSADHEAGHATVAALLGAPVLTATIDHQPMVRADQSKLSHVGIAAIAIAGPIAGSLGRRHLHRPHDAELVPYIAAVRECSPGQCDFCVACRCAVVATRSLGGMTDDAPVLRWLRHVEGRVIEVLKTPAVRLAASRIAAAMREVGTVNGEAVERIVSECVEPALMAAIREEIENVQDR